MILRVARILIRIRVGIRRINVHFALGTRQAIGQLVADFVGQPDSAAWVGVSQNGPNLTISDPADLIGFP